MIRPCMDAARRAGVLVCHVESAQIAERHPEAREDAEPPDPSFPLPPPVVPGYREKIIARSHGKDYATRSPYARMDRAEVVAPLPGEPFVYMTGQFDRILRRRGIEVRWCTFEELPDLLADLRSSKGPNYISVQGEVSLVGLEEAFGALVRALRSGALVNF